MRFRRRVQKHFSDGDNLIFTWAVACDVIAHFLGEKWVRKNLNPKAGNPYFLMTASDDGSVAGYLRQHRVITLGFRLFDLQAVPGFSDAIVGIQSRTLEAAVAELVAVTRLRDAGHQVRFVTPSGVKGADYDAEAKIQGLSVAIEVKAKEEFGAEGYRDKSLVNKLKKASAQVPSGGPSLVFLQLPSDWVSIPGICRSIDSTVRTWLGTSGRVNAVILIFDQRVPGKTGRMALAGGYHVIPNLRPRVRLRNILDILGNAPTRIIRVNSEPSRRA